MRDQGRIHGPSGDPVEYLRRTISGMRREIDDLYRRLGDKPPKINPPSDSILEAFQARSIGISSNTVTAGNSVDLHFRWNQTGAKRWKTAGVSGLDGSDTDTVSVPAGLWVFKVDLALTASGGTPTSGHVDVQFGNSGNTYARTWWREIAESGTCTTEHIWIDYYASAHTEKVTLDNFTNVSMGSTGYFHGFQIAPLNELTEDPS